MKYLSIIARVCVPAAMIVFLAYEISGSMAVEGWWYWLLLTGSFASAVGIEVVGILAGHILEGYWRIGDQWRALLAFVLLLAYTMTAVIILRSNAVMVYVPVVAAIVYLLSSLSDGLETAISQQVESEADEAAWQREQAAKDKELARELRLQRLANKRAIKLAEIEQRASIELAQSQIELAQSQQRANPQPAESQVEPAAVGCECPECHREFATVQALNAHSRFCQGRLAGNGQGDLAQTQSVYP